MPTDVVMPQMGESIFEGTITKWLKKPGDKVQRDEPLFEISTDKVDAEIPAPATGILQEIKVSEGSTVQVNAVVGVIGAGNAASRPLPPPPQKPLPRLLPPQKQKPPPRRPLPSPAHPLLPVIVTTILPTSVLPRSSANSPASTTSISQNSAAPAPVAASPSRTSSISSSVARGQQVWGRAFLQACPERSRGVRPSAARQLPPSSPAT